MERWVAGELSVVRRCCLSFISFRVCIFLLTRPRLLCGRHHWHARSLWRASPVALDQISLTDDHPKDGAWPNMFSSDALEANVFFYSLCSLFSLSSCFDKPRQSLWKYPEGCSVRYLLFCIPLDLHCVPPPHLPPSLALLLVVHLAAQWLIKFTGASKGRVMGLNEGQYQSYFKAKKLPTFPEVTVASGKLRY